MQYTLCIKRTDYIKKKYESEIKSILNNNNKDLNLTYKIYAKSIAIYIYEDMFIQ